MARRLNTYFLDYPTVTTVPTAADYNDLESGIDALCGPARVVPVYFRAAMTTALSLAASTDTFAQAGWTSQKDTDAAGHMGSSTSGDLCTWTCPLAGRLWEIELHAIATGQATGNFAGHVTLNQTGAVTNSIAAGSIPMTNANENHLVARRNSVALAKNDVVRWALWASVATNVATVILGVPTEIVIKDVGPQ